jgi:predicted Fe-Mo cluster-binding NifX family protein
MTNFTQNDGPPISDKIEIVATPIVEGRIAPLFDVARHLLVIEYRYDREIQRRKAHIGQVTLLSRLRILSSNGVDVLICEAVSAPLEMLVVAEGIKVIHHVCGSVEPVLEAYVAGRLTEDAFVMPGCGGCRRRSFGEANGVQEQ